MVSEIEKIKRAIDFKKRLKADPDIEKVFQDAAKSFTDSCLEECDLKAIYGQESVFGTVLSNNKKKGGDSCKGVNSARGHFQFEKKTAKKYGLKVSDNKKKLDKALEKDKGDFDYPKAKELDERYDLKKSAEAAEKYLKDLEKLFKDIDDCEERRKFIYAAYNAGQGRIEEAQELAKKNGKDKNKWDDVKDYLKDAMPEKWDKEKKDEKFEEINEYVTNVAFYRTLCNKTSEELEKMLKDKEEEKQKNKEKQKK